jgi:hypothetical protein
VRSSDTPSRYRQFRASMRIWAGHADEIFNNTAAAQGGVRHIRFVHDANCQVTVPEIVLSPTGDDSLTNTINELGAKGFNRADRKYMLFADTTAVDSEHGSYCGMATTPFDTQPGPNNISNLQTGYGRLMSSCWAQQNFVVSHLFAHELVHVLGAIHHGAPNASGDGHCTDGSDVMCGGPSVCAPNSTYAYRLDCNGDDYFNVNPTGGSYLASHWNIANSQFLRSGGPAPSCSDPGETDDGWAPQVTIQPGTTLRRGFCSADDFDYVNIPLAAGVTYTIQSFNLSFGADTSMQLYPPGGSFSVASNDEGGVVPSASLINYTPDTSGTFLLAIQNPSRSIFTGVYPEYAIRVSSESNDNAIVGKPRPALVNNQTLGNPAAKTWTVKTKLEWSVFDDYGIGWQHLRESMNGGTFSSTSPQPTPGIPSATVTQTINQTHRYEIQAANTIGRVGAVVTSATIRPIAHQEGGVNVTLHGTWIRQASGNYFGGFLRYTPGGVGTKAVFQFNGRRVAVVGAQRPNGGVADVFIDGVKHGTVDFASPTTKNRRVLFVKNDLPEFAPGGGKHVLELRWVSGRMYVDGFITIR